jgi:site-specific DNA-methyltransferase (adenine-specific)
VTNSFWEQIATTSGEALHSSPAETRGVVVVSSSGELTADAARVLAECVRLLRPGGWLFVYGRPRELPSWGEHLVRSEGETWQMVFKYWVALEMDDTPRDGFLKPCHRSLLMFLKTDPRRKWRMPFYLNTAEVKVPHQFCAACKLNLKDWGGKKHLMNPKGIALSDVWRDLPKQRLKNSIAPEVVLQRIRALTEREGERGLHVIQAGVQASACSGGTLKRELQRADLEIGAPMLVRDEVYLGDCVSFLEGVAKEHPEGVFDLAFADPPYNLAKNYDAYDDALADQNYLEWCNRWLDGMARTLKPGGSLLVLNLPKWAIHHAAFLNARLDFRHWIAWDALSDPRGKIMPAHYALLYYTKPGGKPVFNYSPLMQVGRDTPCAPHSPRTKPGAHGVSRPTLGTLVSAPDSPKYCLRAACVKKRKQLGEDEKVELSDIWFDIHRIKHKRDRDAHPCQLPEKLMERIIRLTTNRGDLVFDPFCGVGTTAIAAARLGRHFAMVDSDPKYVEIAKAKLAAMKEHADMFGEFVVPRRSTRRERAFITKKTIETFLQQLARKLGRVPTEEEIHRSDGEMLAAIDRIYPNRGAALKRCKVVL